jgi:hypothetical protein
MWDMIKKRCQEFVEEYRMWKKLHKTTAPDCRGQLLWELLMNPNDLRQRYEAEQQFQRNMDSRWKK